MSVTREILAEKIIKYLNREINLSELIDWSEKMICEADFEDGNVELIRGILGHIGLSDVKEFGLTWDDCYEYLHKLGYDISIHASKVK